MGKVLSKAKAKQFHTFLQTHILNEKITFFRPFRGGNCSYTFFVETKSERFVAKIILQASEKNKLHSYLETQVSKFPVLCGIKMDKIFEYEGKICTLQKNYGTPLPRRHFSPQIIKQVFTEYTKIVNLCTVFHPIDSNYNINHKVEQYQQTINALSADKTWHTKILLKFLRKIPPETLKFIPKNLRIIHGDFFNNQILIQDNQLSAFIDWDNIRTGYPAEDFWNFIYFNMKRLRNPFLYNYWCKHLITQVQNIVNCTYDEWQTAINSSLVSLAYRLTYDYKFKRLLKFLYLYYISTQALKQIKNTIST